MDELIGPLPRTGGHRASESGPAENNLIPGAHLRFAGYRITANTTRGQLADLTCAMRSWTHTAAPYPLVMKVDGAPGHSPRSPYEKGFDQHFRWSKG